MFEIDLKSINDQIECLARLTGAPESFVGQVKSLFENKGISLDSEATPYIKALEEAFSREENIRTSARKAQVNLGHIQKNFKRINEAYTEQLDQLKRLQSGLRKQGRALRNRKVVSGTKKSRPTAVAVSGSHRAYVTRPQSDTMPMVPGPDDLQ